MTASDGSGRQMAGVLALLAALAVIGVGGAVGGAILADAGSASAVPGPLSSDDDGPVAEGCPSADALRQEVYDELENRSVDDVRAEIPEKAVECLPSDVRDVLEFEENESSGSGGENGTDAPADDDCPPADVVRSEVDAALAHAPASAVRAELPDEYESCLPDDVRADLQMDAGAGQTTDAATTSTTAASGSDTPAGTDDGAGTGCPSADVMREEVNRALEQMPVAQFRTMIPQDQIECLPDDVKERLGFETTGTTATSGSGAADSTGGADASAGDATEEGAPGSGERDADGDGVVDSRDHAPHNASVQYADADGDGVPDQYDYAPRDADVQEKGDVQGAAGGGGDDDGLPLAAGSALLLVLAAGVGASVYRHYGGSTGPDGDGLPASAAGTQQSAGSAAAASSLPATAGDAPATEYDVFGESAFDAREELAFDAHDADEGFVFDNEPEDDEDVITLESDDSLGDEAADAGFVFEGGTGGDDAGEPADD